MASQNIARLGVVLGIDTATWQKDIDEAIAQNRKLAREIKKENTAAEKEIERLTYAVKDYGREVSMVEKIQREFLAGGRFEKATSAHKQMLYEQARAYDELAMASKKANLEMTKSGSIGMLGGREGMAKLTQQQIAALSYQATDIVTGLVSGQNPLIILIQQGGQLRDQFGGFKPLFEAIGRVFTTTRVIIGGLAAAMGTLAFAAFKGAEEFERLRDDLILTNNYAGITTGTFNSLVATLSKVSNISIGGAKDIFGQLVSSGKFTQESMFAVGEAIARVSKLSGEAADQVAKNLIPNFDGSVGAAKRLNEQYRFLTVEQYKQIELLNLQGKTQEAIRITAEALTNSFKGQTRELGLLEQAYGSAKNAASEFWDLLLSVGKSDTTEKTVENLRKALVSAAEALQQNLSPMARKRAQELYDSVLQSYQQNVQKLQAERDANDQKALQKAKEQQDLEDYILSGGLAKRKSLIAENEKIIADMQFEMRSTGLSKFQTLELEYAKNIQQYITEQLKLGEEERFKNQDLRLEMIANKSLQLWNKTEKAKSDISREQEKTIRDRQATEQLSIDQERQKQELFNQNILISQTDLKLAESKLRTQAEIDRIMREGVNLTPEVRDQLIQQQEELGRAREAVINYGKQFDILKSSSQAIFGSMNQAISDFVDSGKFKFADFTLSVIRNLIKIQMQAQATQILSQAGGFIGGLFGNIGTAFTYGTGIGTEQTAMLAAQNKGLTFADGGSPPVGIPSLVGERGPELFVPRTSGTIIPNNQLANLGGNTYVTNNYIDAIDTKSFEDRLYGSSKAVWAANQYGNKNISTSRMRT